MLLLQHVQPSIYCCSFPEQHPATSAISTNIIFRNPKFLHQLRSMHIQTHSCTIQHDNICRLDEKTTRKQAALSQYFFQQFETFPFPPHSTNYKEGCLNYWNAESPNHIFMWLKCSAFEFMRRLWVLIWLKLISTRNFHWTSDRIHLVWAQGNQH